MPYCIRFLIVIFLKDQLTKMATVSYMNFLTILFRVNLFHKESSFFIKSHVFCIRLTLNGAFCPRKILIDLQKVSNELLQRQQNGMVTSRRRSHTRCRVCHTPRRFVMSAATLMSYLLPIHVRRNRTQLGHFHAHF